MIIAIVTNPQGQAQMSWEPHDPATARKVLAAMLDLIDQQFPQFAPPGKARIIVPNTVIPPDIIGGNNGNGNP